MIRKYDLDMIYISGPGHGAPAVISNCYLEGTYSEIYPEKSLDEAGMLKLFRAFSFPGQLGSHCTPEMPGSIHEGGELGYSISHAFGAAFDNPELIVSVVVGDGEAETGPLATSWHSNKFLNPIRDGAVLPILHLNGYKIANPTLLARISPEELEAVCSADTAGRRTVVEGDDPQPMHPEDGRDGRSTACSRSVRFSRKRASERRRGSAAMADDHTAVAERMDRAQARWMATRWKDSGERTRCRCSIVQTNPEHLRIVEEWMRSYKPEELFDQDGTLVPRTAGARARGERRMSANPHANGGKLRKAAQPAGLPRLCGAD